MAKLVNDLLPSKVNLDPLEAPGVEVNTFGDDIELPPPLPPIPPLPKGAHSTFDRTGEATSKARSHNKPPKIKEGNLRSYIYTELAELDEEWADVYFQLNVLEDGHDMDVDEQEDQLEEVLLTIEGQVQAIFQLGRYFGISVKDMTKLFPNILEDGKFYCRQIAAPGRDV